MTSLADRLRARLRSPQASGWSAKHERSFASRITVSAVATGRPAAPAPSSRPSGNPTARAGRK
jgi:hypothetical protein